MKKDIIELEKSIKDKLIKFEDNLIKNRKQIIEEELLIKNIDNQSKLLYFLNNILAAMSLGRIMSTIFVSEVKTSMPLMMLHITILIISGVYVYHYINKTKHETEIKKDIKALSSLKDMTNYITILPMKFIYMGLLINKSNLLGVKEKIGVINDDDMKDFITQLTDEELIYIMKVLEKHSNKNGFSINLINNVKKFLKKETKKKTKEDNLIEKIKNMKQFNGHSDDLLIAMQEHCHVVQETKIEKKHVLKDML